MQCRLTEPRGRLFDGDGKLTTAQTTRAYALGLQSGNKFIVAGVGNTGSNLALARYNLDGSLDAAFDGDGIVLSNIYSPDRVFLAFQTSFVAGQVDKIVLATGTSLVRYIQSDGSLDTTFGSSGVAYTGITINERKSIAGF